jgi:hypothetical protein
LNSEGGKKMQKSILKIFLVLVLSIVFVSIAGAQRQTGSLAGKVVDERNEPLPGVTVTLSGPALQGTLSFVTTETGAYRFPALSPGANYVITYELAGFNKLIQEGITITVGKTATIDVTLTQAALSEEVTIVAPTPAVDVTSTKVSVTLTKALLDSIPMGRDIWEIVNSVPGSILGDLRFTVSHGSEFSQSRHTLDGVSMNDPSSQYPLMKINPDIIEEIEVELDAHPAEVGGVAGASINIVTSSGGNKFHGNTNLYYFNKSFVDKNFTREQLDTLKVSQPTLDRSILDTSFALGGPVLKDKLWFFVNGGYLNKLVTVLGFPEDVTNKEYTAMAKLTFRMSKNLKLMAYANYFYWYNDKASSAGRNPTQWTDPDSVLKNIEPTLTLNFQLNWILSQNAFLDLRALQIKRTVTTEYQKSHVHPISDRGTGMTTGAASQQQYYKRHRPLVLQGSLTLFKDNFLGGNHEFKTGAEVERTWTCYGNWTDEPIAEYTWFGSPYYYGGNRGRFTAYAYPINKGDLESSVEDFKYSFYAQDSFTIGRFTLNIGARYDSQHGSYPAQKSAETPYWLWLNPTYFSAVEYPEAKDIVAWNTFSPRFGLVFDIFGKGKTIAKASVNRYYFSLIDIYYEGSNPNRGSYIAYDWTDNNRDGIRDPGDTYIETTRSGRGDWDPRLSFAPDFHSPHTDEITLGIDHELLPNFKLGISFMYKTLDKMNKLIERDRDTNWAKTFTVNDPGYDGVFGTGDDQKLTVYDRTAPFVVNYNQNLPEAWKKYRGLEFIFEKRMSNKWQLLGSITLSKSWGTSGLLSSGDAAHHGFATPNALINNEGRLDLDRPLQIKLQGSYQLPYGINISGFLIHMSGDTYMRSVDVYAPLAKTYVRVKAEPRGTRRNPSWNRLDLRLEKEFAFGDFGRLGVYIDAYNSLNAANITTSTSIHGYIEQNGTFRVNPAWKTVSSTSIPRVIKLGLRFTF